MSVLYSAMSCVICDNDRKGCEEIDISKIRLKYNEIQVLDNHITATLDSLFFLNPERLNLIHTCNLDLAGALTMSPLDYL